MSQPKSPLDSFPYARDSRSQPIAHGIADGNYLYVQDLEGIVHILPDGGHLHPKILGGGAPALYAGDLQIKDGEIVDVTNLSGTFQFDEPEGLLVVARQLAALGFKMKEGAVRFFPMDGCRAYILE
jgi:hypothetical protein